MERVCTHPDAAPVTTTTLFAFHGCFFCQNEKLLTWKVFSGLAGLVSEDGGIVDVILLLWTLVGRIKDSQHLETGRKKGPINI